MDRRDVLERIRKGELNQTSAAKLLGVSRQRVNQMYAKWRKKQGVPVAKNPDPAPAPHFEVVKPAADPLKDIFESEHPAEPLPPAPPPKNIDEVLRPVVTVVPDESGPSPEPSKTLPPDAPHVPDGGEGIDPEDAEAGRELLSYGRKLLAEAAAKWGNVKDVSSLKEENKFLKVALKRNSDKAAPLGWLTRGWKGLLIGVIIEGFRVVLLMEPPPPGPSSKIPNAEPEQPATILPGEEQEPSRPRKTLAEKIADSEKRFKSL